jgi:pyruvate-formate lyase-activating enzyme
MEKRCPDHGPFRALVEKDEVVYRILMNSEPSARSGVTLVIPVTHHCNLRCSMCFYPDEPIPDPSFKAIRRMIEDFPGPMVVFSGGEPTVRRDLPELIACAARRGKDTCIATNGLKLHDRSLVARLADAGLRWCLLSFNGLEEHVFEAVEGRPLLKEKLAALENLMHSPVQPVLSVTLVPGVNDGVLPAMVRFMAERRDRLEYLRLRTHAAIGRHRSVRGSCVSEVLDQICRAWRVDRGDLLEGLRQEPVYHGAEHFYAWLLCDGDDGRTVRDFRFSEPVLHGGTATERRQDAKPEEVLWRRIQGPGRFQIYRVRLFAWPDILNLDLDEDRQTGVWHIGPAGKSMPFFQAIILNQHRPDWNWG